MRFIVPLVLGLLTSPALAQHNNHVDVISDDGLIEYYAPSAYGESGLVQVGSPYSTQVEFLYQGSNTAPLEIAVDFEAEVWQITDGTDELSFSRTASGFTLTRAKAGYIGNHTATFDADGNLLSENNLLGVGMSAQFQAALQSLEGHYNSIPFMANSRDSVGRRDMSCGMGLTLGGLAIIGESILYGLSWFGSPVVGLASTPVYILAVHQTNRWAMSTCRV